MIAKRSLLIVFMNFTLLVMPETNKGVTLRAEDYGKPSLWRTIKVPENLLSEKGFAGDIRIGDLNGDGNIEFILFRSTDGGMKPCFIGAFDLNGQELWRQGAGGDQPQRPGPVTVYDFDGDGQAEVLCFFINPAVKAPVNSMNNVVIQIRDGSTGKVTRTSQRSAASQSSKGFGPAMDI